MPNLKKQSEKVSVSTNTNSMFKSVQDENKTPNCVQNVNVEINIDQKDDCMAGCFKALTGMFKR